MNYKNEIYRALVSNDEDWTIGYHDAKHKTGVEYWTSNGIFFFTQQQRTKVDIGIINWVKLYFYIRRLRRIYKKQLNHQSQIEFLEKCYKK